MKNKTDIICPICGRTAPVAYQEKHHVVPKALKGTVTILVCSCCGDMIHKIFTVRELKNTYNTVDMLLSHEKMQSWVKWISKRPNKFRVCMKSKKKR